MAYTTSGIQRRKDISDLAQALAGSKHRTAEQIASQKEGRKNRMFGLLGKGVDFASSMAQQKARGTQELEQIGARGVEERLTEQERYAEGSAYTQWEAKLQEKQARLKAQAADPESEYYVDPSGDVRATQFLVDWLVNADPKTREMYFEMMRRGTVTTEKDSDGLDGPSLIGAMYNDYVMSAQMKGEKPEREGFRAWVNANLQPMPGFEGLTDQQKQSVLGALDDWISILFGEEVAETPAGTREGGGFFSQQAEENEQELLRKVMAARDAQMIRAEGMDEYTSIDEQWQPIVKELEQPGYLDIKRQLQILKMVSKILNRKEVVPKKPRTQTGSLTEDWFQSLGK